MLPSSRTPKPAFVNPPLKSEVILNVLNSSMVQVWAPLAISLAAPLIIAEFRTVMPLVPTVSVLALVDEVDSSFPSTPVKINPAAKLAPVRVTVPAEPPPNCKTLVD